MFTSANALAAPSPPGSMITSYFSFSLTLASVVSAQIFTSRLHLTHSLSPKLAMVTQT